MKNTSIAYVNKPLIDKRTSQLTKNLSNKQKKPHIKILCPEKIETPLKEGIKGTLDQFQIAVYYNYDTNCGDKIIRLQSRLLIYNKKNKKIPHFDYDLRNISHYNWPKTNNPNLFNSSNFNDDNNPIKVYKDFSFGLKGKENEFLCEVYKDHVKNNKEEDPNLITPQFIYELFIPIEETLIKYTHNKFFGHERWYKPMPNLGQRKEDLEKILN